MPSQVQSDVLNVLPAKKNVTITINYYKYTKSLNLTATLSSKLYYLYLMNNLNN